MPDPITGLVVAGGSLLGSAYSGRQARKGAENAADTQAAAEREGLAALRADLDPYNQMGLQSSPMMMGNVWGMTKGADGTFAMNESPYQELTASQLLNDPFFNELSRSQNESLLSERAAMGLGSSGGTDLAMNRNLLMLGNDFRQQHLQNSLTKNQQRFNQLMGITTLGQNSAARTGAASQQSAINVGQLNSVSPLARAQERSNLVGGLTNLAGMGMMAYGQGAFNSPVGTGSATGGYQPGVQFNASKW